jgi:hypothetical protein
MALGGLRDIFNRTLSRLTGAGISTDSRIARTKAAWSGRADKSDWRVRLQIPNGANAVYDSILANNELMEPLVESRGIFWPLTPAVVIQHSANYNPLSQTHSNYPFQAYQNSQVDSLNIIGEFPVQNSDDAKHWVATVNFLRTITKMYFGKEQALKGNPPPIMHLSGYGDYVFNKVPVIVNTFNVELRPGIDYISTNQNQTELFAQSGGVGPAGIKSDGTYGTARDATRELSRNAPKSWAPTLSNISVLVTPVYSRESIKNFSLSDFARGNLSGKGENEIGFI